MEISKLGRNTLKQRLLEELSAYFSKALLGDERNGHQMKPPSLKIDFCKLIRWGRTSLRFLVAYALSGQPKVSVDDLLAIGWNVMFQVYFHIDYLPDSMEKSY